MYQQNIHNYATLVQTCTDLLLYYFTCMYYTDNMNYAYVFKFNSLFLILKLGCWNETWEGVFLQPL